MTPPVTTAANGEVLNIAQIETEAGVNNIERITAVAGLDAVLVGPADLSISLGHAGDLRHPDVITAIEHIASTAYRNNSIFGIHGPDWLLEHFATRGMNLIVSQLDINILGTQMANIAKKWSTPSSTQ